MPNVAFVYVCETNRGLKEAVIKLQKPRQQRWYSHGMESQAAMVCPSQKCQNQL